MGILSPNDIPDTFVNRLALTPFRVSISNKDSLTCNTGSGRYSCMVDGESGRLWQI